MRNLFSFLLASSILLLGSCCHNSACYQKESESGSNQTLETIFKRKSVRSFTEQSVSMDTLLTLVKAGMAAPTGMDKRPWEFVIVTERAMLDTLSVKFPYGKMLAKAPAAIVVMGNENQSMYWYLDCAAATENILLAAESMNLGGVWVTAYPYEERMRDVAGVLGTPDSIKTLCVIPIGHPKGEPKAKEKWNENKVRYQKW